MSVLSLEAPQIVIHTVLADYQIGPKSDSAAPHRVSVRFQSDFGLSAPTTTRQTDRTSASTSRALMLNVKSIPVVALDGVLLDLKVLAVLTGVFELTYSLFN